MEYVYAALLIHKAGGKVDEASLKRVVESAGVKANDAKIKALVAALEGKNIDEAIKKASAVPVAVVAASASAGRSSFDPLPEASQHSSYKPNNRRDSSRRGSA